jgi:hypothetical protein
VLINLPSPSRFAQQLRFGGSILFVLIDVMTELASTAALVALTAALASYYALTTKTPSKTCL